MISKADLISMEQDLETGFGHSIKNNKDYIKTIIDLILKSTFSFWVLYKLFMNNLVIPGVSLVFLLRVVLELDKVFSLII